MPNYSLVYNEDGSIEQAKFNEIVLDGFDYEEHGIYEFNIARIDTVNWESSEQSFNCISLAITNDEDFVLGEMWINASTARQIADSLYQFADELDKR